MPERIEGGHRWYKLRDLVGVDAQSEKVTIAYARVSSQEQKSDLERQSLVLSAYCESNRRKYQLIQDLFQIEVHS